MKSQFLKVSIITVCKNSQDTIEKTINSVLSQNYPNIEYIIIDGKSHDNTINIINKYINKISNFISSNDKNFYDGLNKGISLSSGDLIGTLNSDDFLANENVISKIVDQFVKNPEIKLIYGNVYYYKTLSTKYNRLYRVKNFSIESMLIGICAPHQTIYCKKEIFNTVGYYDTSDIYKVISDFDFVLRILMADYKFFHIDDRLVTMKAGGMSNKNLIRVFQNNLGFLDILKKYKFKVNIIQYIFKKFLKRIFELII